MGYGLWVNFLNDRSFPLIDTSHNFTLRKLQLYI